MTGASGGGGTCADPRRETDPKRKTDPGREIDPTGIGLAPGLVPPPRIGLPFEISLLPSIDFPPGLGITPLEKPATVGGGDGGKVRPPWLSFGGGGGFCHCPRFRVASSGIGWG